MKTTSSKNKDNLTKKNEDGPPKTEDNFIQKLKPTSPNLKEDDLTQKIKTDLTKNIKMTSPKNKDNLNLNFIQRPCILLCGIFKYHMEFEKENCP